MDSRPRDNGSETAVKGYPNGKEMDRAVLLREFYDATAAASPGFWLMNFGYAADNVDDCSNRADPEYYSRQLYRHVLHSAELKGQRVVEISCGRGGGARFVKQAYDPEIMRGLDLSEGNIGLARERFGGVNGLEFEVGTAQALPYTANEFDAAINIEASHLYDDREKFYLEVGRVLRPGGYFFYADRFGADFDATSALELSGFTVVASDDITVNVLNALNRDSARREKIIEETVEPDKQETYRHWAGVKDHEAYNRLQHGELVYLSYVLRCPPNNR